MRRLFVLLSFALAVTLIVMAIFGPRWGAQANDSSGNETAAVEKIDVTVLVSTSGIATAERSALVSFGTSGTVAEILVDVGDAVTAGQTLAQLDTRKVELAVANAEQALLIARSNFDRLTGAPSAAQIAAAEATIAGARAQLTAAENSRVSAPEQQKMNCLNVDTAALNLSDAQQAYDDYVKSGLLYDATFAADPNSQIAAALLGAQNAFELADAQCRVAEIAARDSGSVEAAMAGVAQAEAQLAALTDGATEAEIAISEAQVRQAEIALEQAQQTLEDSFIRAQFSGVISEQQFRVGQVVSPTLTGMTVVDPATLYFDVSVDELDVPQLESGQSVEIRVDALDGELIEGVVSRVAPAGRVVQGVTTYAVQINLTGERPERLRLGMGADIDIVVGRETGVLAVPTRAIQRNEGEEYVLVDAGDEEPREVTVRTGQTVGDKTVIEGEIAEGDVVYVDVPQRTIFRFGGAGGR
ncbi:MAG: efflux RND transporter periplasmic adaptor subunit [Chloroflexi bacterium]|nr:efflux RND transporter periplasmic adaptor subunit [Chloroflexota bacterium]